MFFLFLFFKNTATKGQSSSNTILDVRDHSLCYSAFQVDYLNYLFIIYLNLSYVLPASRKEPTYWSKSKKSDWLAQLKLLTWRDLSAFSPFPPCNIFLPVTYRFLNCIHKNVSVNNVISSVTAGHRNSEQTVHQQQPLHQLTAHLPLIWIPTLVTLVRPPFYLHYNLFFHECWCRA